MLGVLGVFAVQGGWPAPDVNEAHYLCRARHFWNPSWISGDFFLDSADAHSVFCATLGWLTLFLSLEQFAWVGRFLVWSALAWSWTRLSRAVVPGAGWSVLTAAAFLAVLDATQLAGEWVVGGLEAKGLAYAFVFAGLAQAVRGRWDRCWLWWGLASSFHVLVGGWMVLAGFWAWLWIGRSDRSFRQIVPGIILGGLFSLPGLVPVLAMNLGQPADAVVQADFVYVFHRLPHHLYWPWFALERRVAHLALVALWLALLLILFARARPRRDRRAQRLELLVSGALVLSAVGFAIPYAVPPDSPWLAALLKYYWFRLADVLIPLGVVLGLPVLARGLRRTAPQPVRTRWVGWASCALLVLIASAHLVDQARQKLSGAPSRLFRADQVALARDWEHACRWIARETPRDARFLTPAWSASFHWYAERAEVVNRKDLPQDASGINAWWERYLAVHYSPELGRYVPSLNARDPAKLQALAARYQADYLLVESSPELPFLKIFPESGDSTFAVYDLRRRDPPRKDSSDSEIPSATK